MKRRLSAPNKWLASPRKGLMKIFTSTLLAILVAISAVAPAHAQIVEKKSLNLDGAKKAIAAAVDYAKKNNAPGGVIAIVDEGGNLMALERLDGTFAMGATISIGKARTAVLFKKPTRFFEELINKGRTAMTAVDGFTPLIGGIPIVIDGQVVGGIGVSGAASANQDEELALAGAAAFSESTKARSTFKSSVGERGEWRADDESDKRCNFYRREADRCGIHERTALAGDRRLQSARQPAR